MSKEEVEEKVKQEAENELPNEQENETTAHDDKKIDPLIRELRAEAKSRRLEAKKANQEAAEAKQLAQKVLDTLEQQTKKNTERLIRAELKSYAVTEGANDIDDIMKLADLSAVTVDENGDVIGIAEAISKLKESKKYLFGELKSTSANPKMPSDKSSDAPKAKDWSDEEWNKQKAKFGLS